MDAVNGFLTTLAGWLLAPLATMPRTALLVVAVIAGVVMPFVFRHASNQRALRRAVDRGRASLLCMRLFKDDIRVAVASHWDLLKAAALRLWHALPPFAVMVIPFAIVLTQLALRYEHRPLRPGEATVVSLAAADAAWPAWRGATLEVPEGVRVETPAFRDEARHAVLWRVRAVAATTEPLRFRAGSDVVRKDLVCADGPDALEVVSTRRAGPGVWDRLLHPGEPAFGRDAPVRAIEIAYPARITPILGIRIPWWGTLLIVSMVTALLVRPILGVRF